MLREPFEIFDTNNDGVITILEIPEVLESLGYNCSNEELKEMVNEMDIDGDGDGAIDFEEFEQLMEETDELEEAECKEDLCQAFYSADGDALRELIDSLCIDIDDDELHELIDSVDHDGDGFISSIQFIEIIFNI